VEWNDFSGFSVKKNGRQKSVQSAIALGGGPAKWPVTEKNDKKIESAVCSNRRSSFAG
jgi:hypothetical protein